MVKKKKPHVTLALVQMRASVDPRVNRAKAITSIKQAKRQGAQIVCLQELFAARYFPQEADARHFHLAETIPGPTTRALATVAREQQVVIVASIFEKRTQGIFHNTAVVIDADGSLVGKYRKMHIPDDPCFYEKFYFTPGDLGFQSFQTRYAHVGILICWDQWFPEAARLTALAGAQIIIYPTAIGWHKHESQAARTSQREAWQLMQRSHAIANGTYVAVPNRVGREGSLTFWGSSFVADPFGRIVAAASQTEEEILFAQCDLKAIDTTRQEWPFLRDRRIDAYHALTNRCSHAT